MASIFGGLLGIGPGIYILGHVIQRHGGGALAVIVGTLAVLLTFGTGSMGFAWLTLRLDPKP